LHTDTPGKDGRGSHRSHRSRTSGGFLLSNAALNPVNRDVTPAKLSAGQNSGEYKGKAVLRSPDKRHRKRKSDLGVGLRGSPLAGHVTTLAAEDEESDPAAKDLAGAEQQETTQPASGILDVNSAQIVNLALNLSESRKNVSRRLVSNPLPSPVGALPEAMAGGSMRYHMQQQQRRSSRNASPKPERGGRHSSLSSRMPSGQRQNSPLQAGFDDGVAKSSMCECHDFILLTLSW